MTTILRDEKGRVLPGSTLNPKGRPPGIPTLSETLKKAIEEYRDIKLNGEQVNKPIRELLIMKMIDMAMKGNVAIMKEIWDRIDGKAVQRVINHQTTVNTLPEEDKQKILDLLNDLEIPKDKKTKKK